MEVNFFPHLILFDLNWELDKMTRISALFALSENV